MMPFKLLMQFLHIPWPPEGKKDFRGVLLVLIASALALILYSFHISRGEHNPPFLSHHIDHLDLVRSKPHDDLSHTHRARSISPPDEDHPLPYAKESLISSNEVHHHHKCEGKYLYIYKLPPDFNEVLVDKCGRTSDVWAPLCGNLNNNGYGPSIPNTTLYLNESNADTFVELEPPHAWFRTEQFSLEVIFHERLRNGYPCLTQDPELADAFYIPYYAALDTAFTLFDKRLSTRDRLAQRLIGWLSGSEVWAKFQGSKKHFMVLGRISWDFSREEKVLDGWGSSLLSQVELSNVTKLLIERRSWVYNEIAIPYPTSFHPSSLQEMELWQGKLRGRMSKRSNLLSSFIGSTTRGTEWSRTLRAALAKQCDQVDANICQKFQCGDSIPGTLDCARNPEHVNALFLSSMFCLQPSGDSPTRKGFFDSLLAGCIPVLFIESSAYTQYMWHLPQEGSRYSVLFKGDDVIRGNVDIFATLAGIAKDTRRLRRMQEEVINMLPQIVYSLPGKRRSDTTFCDAVDVALESLLAGSPIPKV